MAEFKPKLKATGVGTLPLSEPESAVEYVLGQLPEVPFWPQLVKRSPWEDMVIQAAPGLPGLKIDLEERRVDVDPEADLVAEMTRFYEADLSGDLSSLALTLETAPGYFTLVEKVTQNRGSVERLKGHVTGPVTFGLAVKDAEGRPVLHNPELMEAISRGLGLKGAWQVLNFPAGLEPGLIFLDEPGLSGFGSAFMSLEKDEAIKLLNSAAEPIRNVGGLVGIHVCGNTDWSMVLAADIDVANFDAFGFGEGFVLYTKEIEAFLERGGVLAWGIVPTLDYTGQETAEGLAAHLDELIGHLVGQGMDRSKIIEQSLLTPACGLGVLSVANAEAILNLLVETSRLVRGEQFGRR